MEGRVRCVGGMRCRFSKVFSIVVLCSKCSVPLTFGVFSRFLRAEWAREVARAVRRVQNILKRVRFIVTLRCKHSRALTFGPIVGLFCCLFGLFCRLMRGFLIGAGDCRACARAA
jgi:hypothetical protein